MSDVSRWYRRGHRMAAVGSLLSLHLTEEEPMAMDGTNATDADGARW